MANSSSFRTYIIIVIIIIIYIENYINFKLWCNLMACQFSFNYPIYIHLSSLPDVSTDLELVDLSSIIVIIYHSLFYCFHIDCIYEDSLLPFYLKNNLCPSLNELDLISYIPLPHKFILNLGDFLKDFGPETELEVNISCTPEDFEYLKSLVSTEDIVLQLCCYTDESKTTIETNTLDTQIIKAKDTYDAQNIINRIIFYPNIKKLYLCEIELSQMCIKLLCECLSKKYCPKLEVLDLHESNIDARSIYYVGSLLESKGISELKTLLLYGNNIGYDGVKILNRSLGCGNCPKLETFNVSGDPDECEELYNHLSHPQCPALSSHIPRSSEIDNMFSKIDPKATTLIDLSVKTYSLQAIHVLLSTSPELTSVAELNLSRCHLSPSSFKYLARFIKAGKLPKLRRLNLSFNDINENSMMELCDALDKYELPIEILNLSNCGINSQGIKYLADILEKGKMQFLRLFTLTCIYILFISFINS